MVEGQASLEIYYDILYFCRTLNVYAFVASHAYVIVPLLWDICNWNYFGAILRYKNNERYPQNQAAAPMARTRNALSFVHIPSRHDRIGN